MQGIEEETFWSYYTIGKLNEILEKDENTVTQGYINAFLVNELRAEPLYRLAVYLRKKKKYFWATLVLKQALSIEKPQVKMYSESWVYDYGIEQELCNNYFWMGKYTETVKICTDLLEKKGLPKETRKLIQDNLNIAKSSLDQLKHSEYN